MREYHKLKRTSGRKMSRGRRKRYGKKGLRFIPAALLLLVAVLLSGVFSVKQRSGKKEASLPLESSREVIPESLPEELFKAEGQAETRSIKAGGSAKEMLAQMTLNEKVAQMFVITPEALTGVERVYSAGKTTKEALERYPVGGLIYASGNLESSDQVKTMLDRVKSYSIGRMGVPIFTGIAEEGNENFFSQSEDKGRNLSELGFNLGFIKTASEPVSRESLLGTGKAAAEEVKEFEEGGVKAVLEHFPGYGAVGENKKNGYASTDKGLGDLLAGELIPFQAGIDAGVDFIMVGHIAASQVTGDNTPASLSEIMISDVLRNGMGYEGIVMTESLSASVITRNYSPAEAAVEAVNAGADLLVLPGDFAAAYEGVLEAVKTGKIPIERIDRSLERILSVKISLNQ